MSHDREFRRLFRLPTTARRITNEVRDEIRFHLEERTAQLTAEGMDPESARRVAMREFGDPDEAVAELEEIDERRVRQASRVSRWSDLRQDLHFGIRSAVHAPLFSLLAVLTLALGIGANAAVFGVVKSVLLDSLPYSDADRIVRVYGRTLDGTQERGAMSAGTVTDIMERQRSFERMAAFRGIPAEAVYGGGDRPMVTSVGWVQPDLFRTLGVPAALGRTFTDDDLSPDTARVVVLTHSVWHRLLGGDPAVLGRDVIINGIPRTVIGVLPRGFVGPAGEAEFYFAIDLGPTLGNPVSARRSHWLGMVGRVRPGITHEAARRELTAIAADLAREYPEDNGSISVAAMPIREAMSGDTRTPLLVLMASAGLVLLMTCANLAGAMLSRTISRRKEFAVRVAMGAGRGRLVRQLLTESTVLAIAGGAAGLLIAAGVLALLRGLELPALPPYADLTLDGGAVIVTSLATLLTGLAFGVLPALSVSRADPQGTLRDENRGTSESRGSRRLRGMLVAGQIALCVSLLSGAGLLARSLWAMTTAPLGFDAQNVLTASVQLPNRTHGTPESRAQFQDEFAQRIRALPGVESVASASDVPTAVMSRMGVVIEGAPPPPSDAQPFMIYVTVSDDYFRTLRIPLRQGRLFGAEDHADAPPTIVISEGMSGRFWPNGGAVGARVRLGPDPAAPAMEVVGIVGDVRNDPARTDAEPVIYRSNRQDPWNHPIFLIRTHTDPATLMRPIESELTALDPRIPLDRVITLRGQLSQGLAGRRLPVVLMTSFGVLALLLASVGVYALFASMAAAREREFGVRVALGSSRAAIAGLVLRQGAAWMAVGLLGGAVGVVLVVRAVSDLLYGISPFDPIVLGGTAAILIACAAAALLFPVRRATRADPISIMR